GEVSVRAELRHGKTFVHIADTGIGISHEALERIFQEYGQANANAEAYGGLGVGLSITRQLVELHDGTLTVRSKPGDGSVFTFTLPVAAEEAEETPRMMKEPVNVPLFSDAAAAQPAEEEQHWLQPNGSHKPRVLIVDDDPVNLTVLERILALEPYSIVS